MPQIRFEDPLSDLVFVAFDTETTGLTPVSERVVELSAVRFRLDGSEEGVFDELIDPGRPIPASAARVHGITDEMVHGKPGVGEVLPRFLEFAEQAVLLAHNAEFDLGFLVHEAARAGVDLPHPPVLDTVEISRTLRSDLPNHKLETISRALACPASTYHRALADAQTLSHVFLRLIAQVYADRSLGDLIVDTGSALTFGWPGRTRAWLPSHLQAIDDALVQGVKVTIVYRPEGRRREEAKDIVPQGYLRRPGSMFLVGRGDDGHDRNFRLSWIQRAHMSQATLF